MGFTADSISVVECGLCGKQKLPLADNRFDLTSPRCNLDSCRKPGCSNGLVTARDGRRYCTNPIEFQQGAA